MNEKILVIEDDTDIRELIAAQLKLGGFTILEAADGGQGSKYIHEDNDIDLYIIDWMLPEKDGLELCKEIRLNDQIASKPILMLTAKSEKSDIISGLDSGADDYLTKPFDLDVLMARIRALLRRKPSNSHASKESILSCEDLKLDTNSYIVTLEENEINLTKTELLILEIFLKEPGVVHSRKDLLKKVIGEETFVTERTIDTHLAGLRKKIGKYSARIETVRGIGYRFKKN